MPSTPIQTSFSKGEISEHLRGRRDSSIFEQGLDYCENYWPLAHGPLLSRGPSYDFGLLAVAPGIRFAQLRMSDEQDFVLVLTDHMMRVWSVATGQEEIVTARDLSSNGDFSGGSTSWILRDLPGSGLDYRGTAVIEFGQCVLETVESVDGEGGAPVYFVSKQLRQEITTDGPYAGTVYAKVRSITGGLLGSDLDHESIFLRCLIETGDGAGMITRVEYDRDDPDGIFTIPFTMPPGATHLNVNFYLTSLVNINVPVSACRVELDDVAVVVNREEGFEVATPWASDQLTDLQWDTETAQDHTIFVHGKVAPWSLRYDPRGGGFWRWSEIEFQGRPVNWGADHWPEAVQFHDGRLYLSTKNEIWGSRIGSPFDFRTRTDTDGNPSSTVSASTSVTPECALQRKVATKGGIRWMSSGRVLLLGTDITEHSISGTRGITPSDFQATTESRYGSARKMAADAGSHVLYVSRDRKKIRALAYTQESDGWESKDVTFIGSHLTEDRIKELHYTDGLLLALLDSGKFAACAYNPGEQAVGWWRLRLGGASAEVLTSAVSNGPDGAYLWMAVDRPNGIRMERIELSDPEGDIAYLDSAIDIEVAPGTAVLEGLDHLEGEAVLVTLSGKALESEELRTVEGGEIAVKPQDALTIFTVGVPYRPRAVLLPEAVHGKIHNSTVGILLRDSAIPLINGKRPKDRSPSTSYDTPEPRRTGRVQAKLLGWSDEGKITIEADIPFRSEIQLIYTITGKSED